jgi:hypothetical protein
MISKRLTSAGYGEVSDHCPMCEHRPFSQDLCKPYKAIRNTAKAFLKTHEKKLADERTKAAAAADVALISTTIEGADANATKNNENVDFDVDTTTSEPPQQETVDDTSEVPLEDQPQPSIEVRTEIVTEHAFTKPSQVADEIEVDDDAVNLITEEAPPAATVATDAPTPAKSIEPATYNDASQNEQEKGDSLDQSSMPSMLSMMSINPMLNGMDINQMMQMMTASGMNMNGFNSMLRKSSTSLDLLLPILITLSNAKHGNEYNVTRHVRRFRWSWLWHEWDERHEHGHEFSHESGNVWSWLE